NRNQSRRDAIVPGVMVAGLHVQLPARVAQFDGETDASVDAAGAAALKGDGRRVDETIGIAGVSPPRVDRIASGTGRHDKILIDAGVAIVPATAGDPVHTETGVLDAFLLKPIVRRES